MSTDREEHAARWNDELAAYVLDALGEREAALFEHHLDGCETCRERVRWLSPAVDVLPASVPAMTPPPELRERLMATVEQEAAEAAPPRERRRFRLPIVGGFSMRPALVGLGVALVLIAGVTGYALHDPDSGPEPVTYAAEPVTPDVLASGTLQVEGDRGTLTVSGMPSPPRDEVYQAWVQVGDDGRITPSSVFVVHEDGSGEVAIPHGLDGASRVMITREPDGGSTTPTERPMLMAEIQ